MVISLWTGSSAQVVIPDAVCPIVLWRSSAGFGYYSLIWSGSTATATLHTPSAAGTSVTIYVFDAMPPTPSNYGLQVYNEQGELVYDALSKPLRITQYKRGEAIISTPMEPLNIPLGSEEYAYGNSSFVGSMIGIITPLAPPNFRYQMVHNFRYYQQQSGMLVQRQFTPYQFDRTMTDGTVSQYENTTFDYQVIVADVTNY